jgi:hypothetical protein
MKFYVARFGLVFSFFSEAAVPSCPRRITACFSTQKRSLTGQSSATGASTEKETKNARSFFFPRDARDAPKKTPS